MGTEKREPRVAPLGTGRFPLDKYYFWNLNFTVLVGGIDGL
jgi:hypothetical protein